MTQVLRDQQVRLPLLTGERWWGGAVADGQAMPFGADDSHHRNLAVTAGILNTGEVGGDGPPRENYGGGNQSTPLLLSNQGRFVFSEQAFDFRFNQGMLEVTGQDLSHGRAGDSLRDAFRTAATAFFPAVGKTPAAQLFQAPQYNTWIEMPYRPTQSGVLAYARGLLAAGLPPGVLMIDDRWSPAYGTWTFDPVSFPRPTDMVRQLHELGFSVMLWLVPFISPDTAVFRDLQDRGLLVRDDHGRSAIRRWWNGYSAVLDATNPGAVSWLHGQLDALATEHGVDGFKFDGGDLWSYRGSDITFTPTDPVGQCEAWAKAGVKYPFNEYRACWKMGGQPLAQRLHDKPPTWGAGGLASLIPDSIAQGLIGHSFVCPDMIGGGELTVFEQVGVDAELFVRYAQCAALFPMMQFSVSPGRVLDAEHLAAVVAAVGLHQQLVPDILRLVEHAGRTGEPILRPLAFHHPGFDDVTDQFLLGEDILAAPVLERGATRRRVVLPPGDWQASDGTRYLGPAVIELPTTLRSIPWFSRVREAASQLR
jgi:alpha-glucosidase (family GH31 glycosyl hydrolase)